MEGWKESVLGKIGNTFTGLSGKTKEDFGFGSKYIQYINIFNNSKVDIEQLEFVNVKSNEKQSKVKYGDIFFTTSSETIHEVGMSSVLLDSIEEDIYLNSFCFGFRLFDFDVLLPEYAQYLLRAAHMRHSISMFGKGSTRYNLSKTQLLKELILEHPTSLDEQRKIATILSTIDKSIAQTEQLIAKYKNIKQGLMHDLLTYGVDENGTIRNPQTHSFVEKKEMMVPEEWDVVEIGELADLKSGGTPNRENSTFWNGNIPWVKTSEVNYNIISDTEEYITEKGLSSSSTFLFPKGTILMALYGQGKTRGRVAILDIDATSNQACLGFLNIRKVTTSFLYLSLSYEYSRLRDLSNEGAQKNLSGSLLKKFLLKIPLEISEQNKISEILQSQDKLIESEQTNLTKLQSLKQGLMQDLLTGKVRVKY